MVDKFGIQPQIIAIALTDIIGTAAQEYVLFQ
jgi:hypothetical protein